MSYLDEVKTTITLIIPGRNSLGYVTDEKIIFSNEACEEGQIRIIACGHHDVAIDVDISDLDELVRLIEWTKSA